MIFLAMLFLPPPPEELTLTAEGRGGVTASLTVRVAGKTAQPGTARVQIRLIVEGPADLIVELQPLDDALAGWRVPRTLRTSSYRPDEGCRWECTLDLVQVKPGVVPLPGVRIRVRTGDSEENIAWPDLLHEAANVRSVVEVEDPPPSPWPGRLRWAGFVTMGLVCVGGVVFGVRRWAVRPLPALPPLATALAAIDRLLCSPLPLYSGGEGLGVRGRDSATEEPLTPNPSPLGTGARGTISSPLPQVQGLGGPDKRTLALQVSTNDPTRLIAELDGVLRAYLESLGIPAMRRTGAELCATPHAEELAAVLARGEELKFAGVSITHAQVRELASEARNLFQGIMEKKGRPG